jgi:hypothetical protein
MIPTSPLPVDCGVVRTKLQRNLQQHGLIAILVGLIGGFVLVASLIGGISGSPLPLFLALDVPGTSKGWLGFHLGMLLNGMMALVLERVLATREMSVRRMIVTSWGIAIAVWGNGAFYLFSMFAPNRGLTSDSNVLGPSNIFGQLAYFPAIVGAITLITAVVLLTVSPARESERNSD